MVSRLTLAFTSFVVLLAVHAGARGQLNPYRLKDPDQKKICLSCHTEFEQKLRKRSVHTPVKAGECSGCHDPHVSSHGKLLFEDRREICSRCHDGVIPKNAKSAHRVVADGDCQKCHDPHASDNSANLLAASPELCFGCHTQLGEAVKSARFKHSPVAQGCLTCHDAHGSGGATHLLKTGVPALCVTCHKPDSPPFIARHMKYPVGKAACTSCHDPHGSSQPALLQASVHQPVASGGCPQCHQAPDSTTPFATKRSGFELCKGCHAEMVNATMAKPRLHWPVADRKGCANCHNPHASGRPKLLKRDTATLCGNCHADTLKRMASTTAKHAPVDGGMCTACHSPHAADGVHLVDQPSIVTLCATCHDYQKHSAHPLGDKAVDPRNKNLRVDCLSCHKAHGTQFKWMLLAETNLELCTQCHKKFAR